jgi:hypothetical protein
MEKTPIEHDDLQRWFSKWAFRSTDGWEYIIQDDFQKWFYIGRSVERPYEGKNFDDRVNCTVDQMPLD